MAERHRQRDTEEGDTQRKRKHLVGVFLHVLYMEKYANLVGVLFDFVIHGEIRQPSWREDLLSFGLLRLCLAF